MHSDMFEETLEPQHLLYPPALPFFSCS